MAETSLKQAMSILFDMEKNNYLMTKAIEDIKAEINECRPSIGPVEGYPGPMPTKPEKMRRKNLFLMFWLPFLLITYAGIIIGVVISLQADPNGPPMFAIAGMFIGAIIGGAFGFLRTRTQSRRVNDINKQNLQKYENALSQYNKQMEIYEENKKKAMERAEESARAHKELLKAIKTSVEAKLNESRKALNNYYDYVGILPEYRKLIAVGYMNHELRKNEEMGLPDIYDRVDFNLRMGQIEYSLQEIVSGFNRIIAEGHLLRAELSAMNQRCDQVIKASINQSATIANGLHSQNEILESIRSNTAIAAYNSERTAKEAEYQSYLQRYNRW